MRQPCRARNMTYGSLLMAVFIAAFNGQLGTSASENRGLRLSPADDVEEKLTIWKFPVTDPEFKEGCVSLNEDRTFVAFQSQRPGGYGGYDIWLARFETTGRWSNPQNAGPGVNSDLHEIDVGLTADGKSLFFTRSAFGGRNAVAAQRQIPNKRTDLYVSHYRAGHWSIAELIPPPVSLPDASEFRPVLSRNGKKLYFGSDRKGGYGGYDLYYSEREGGGWREPVNLGSKVNTSADELDASISPDENALILPIHGDLFISYKVDNQWTVPEELGPRFNTPGSDGCPWLGYDGHSLYVNSTWEDLLRGHAGPGGVWLFEYSRGFGRMPKKD